MYESTRENMGENSDHMCGTIVREMWSHVWYYCERNVITCVVLLWKYERNVITCVVLLWEKCDHMCGTIVKIYERTVITCVVLLWEKCDHMCGTIVREMWSHAWYYYENMRGLWSCDHCEWACVMPVWTCLRERVTGHSTHARIHIAILYNGIELVPWYCEHTIGMCYHYKHLW